MGQRREGEIRKLIFDLKINMILGGWTPSSLDIDAIRADLVPAETTLVEIVNSHECFWMVGVELEVLIAAERCNLLPCEAHGAHPDGVAPLGGEVVYSSFLHL